ncbi:hypothetical protein ACFYOY_13720 [Streptomyces sp. NPDC007875]|uniref:hypothetical protein n=1 Tax=Streptomyces sp. NPDC007875 TaxID=3364783 RepID=UPI00369C05E2
MTTTPTPCSFPPCDTGPGEPCDRHEREWSHAEGSHELCGNECSIIAPPLTPERETAIGDQITTALSKAGAFCGTCGFEPGDRGCPDCERCYSDYAAALLPIVRAALATELNPLRGELAAYEVMTPQSCPKGIHADWMADSEHTHTCPWCELDDMGASLRRAAEDAKPGDR